MTGGFRNTEDSLAGSSSFGNGTVGGAPFTHAQIMHLMKAEFARARRYGIPLTCMLFQVDRGQTLVDIHGVELREILRRELGRLVTEKTRDADHLGLISDDRFLLVLPHTVAQQAEVVANRIRESFRSLEVVVNGSQLDLTVSVGLSSCDDKETLFFDTMLSQADMALRWSTDAGGNTAKVFRKERFVESASEAESAPPASD